MGKEVLYYPASARLLDFLERELRYPEVIILFGSAARGEDIERSDIDLFVLIVTPRELDLSKYKGRLADLSGSCSWTAKSLSLPRREIRNP